MEQILGPERPGGQGLDPQQEESGNRAILALLHDPVVCDQVDLVITHRDDAYEVWARRGMVRFQRLWREGSVDFRVIEQIGDNPIADQRHTTIATAAEELRAAAASGHPTEDVNRAFIEPAALSYPHAYERIAQLFDSPYAPDLVISPKCYAFGLQPGQHGALDVVQSRAPLAFAGPGIRPGAYDTAPRHVDIAPTVCRLLGFPKIDGKDASGRTASERGVAPDVYLQRQDGRVLDARGMAQVMVLFDDPAHPPPVLVAHEFTVTDGAGHEYGPHGEGLRTAVAETDRRLGQVLDMLEEKDLLETTLFVFTSDHGMAAQDVSLKANPARHPERIGMQTITGEPMIWLRDLAVVVEPAPDGRTARVTVLANDADESGEQPPLEGAQVLVHAHADKLVAKLTTNAAGIAGFATPVDVRPVDIVLSVQHPHYNPRRVRLDGSNLVIDLRRELYGRR